MRTIIKLILIAMMIALSFSICGGDDCYTIDRSRPEWTADSTVSVINFDTLSSGIQVLIYYPNPSSGEVTIQIFSSEHSFLNILVSDINGRIIKEYQNTAISKGMNDIIWDGCDLSGIEVPNGVYILQFYENGRISEIKIQKSK